jgi:hypothetical protein
MFVWHSTSDSRRGCPVLADQTDLVDLDAGRRPDSARSADHYRASVLSGIHFADFSGDRFGLGCAAGDPDQSCQVSGHPDPFGWGYSPLVAPFILKLRVNVGEAKKFRYVLVFP